uniref:Lipid transferase CIDEA n=1 Tax=Ursus americanus TaxID=9643 RepID=A0A452R2U2_URSAM
IETITSKIFLFFSSISRPLTFMGSQTKRVLLTPLMHSARPFRVSNHDRSSRRGVMATSLKELLNKTLEALVITSGLVTLVLEDDGTVVDTEEFFQTLEDNTHFMILEKGQKWTPVSKNTYPNSYGVDFFTHKRTFPSLVLTCLLSKYILLSLGYMIKCTSLLRLLSHAAQVTGQLLMYAGSYMLQLLGDTEEQPPRRSHSRRGFMCG